VNVGDEDQESGEPFPTFDDTEFCGLLDGVDGVSPPAFDAWAWSR
jgi:hypothetical protein